MWSVKIFGIILLSNVVQSAKILCVFPSPSPSHLIVAKGILTELARSGHETTMVSFFPLEKTIENYRDIVMPQTETYKDFQTMMASNMKSKLNMFLNMNHFTKIVIKLNDEVVKSEIFQKLLAEEKFDLLILGPFMNIYLVGLGAVLNCPMIMFSPAGTISIFNDIIGNPHELAYIPHMMYGIKGAMNFKQRLINIAITAMGSVAFSWVEAKNNDMYQKTFGHIAGFPTYADQKKNISLIFINDHFTQSGSRPLVTNMIEIGGIQIKETPDLLPDDIKNWMEANTNGVIYFSLGSNIKSANLAPEKLEAILRTFGKLKQNVLWKFENDKIDGLPKNVMIKKWLPQDDLLTHPNLRLFITHGGLGSIAESKYHAVPLILMPMFADQMANADKVVSDGWGVKLEYADLTEETLTTAINEILNDQKYKQNVQSWSSLYRDRPHTARQLVVYWTNYVLRYHGAPQLQSTAKELNFIQRQSIDTFGLIFAMLALMLYIQFRVLKLVVRFMLRKLTKSKNKVD